MPIYEYECEQCHKITESWQHLADKPLTTCPECAGELKKLISRSSFHLKGGGWYADGYSNTNNNSNKTTAPSEPEKKTEKKTSDTTGASACPKSATGSCCGCPS